MVSRLVHFLKYDLWRFRTRKLSRFRALGIRSLRVFVRSLREFGNDQCGLRAASLTFFSLLSIVPIFAMAFGIAKGFGLETLLEERLLERFYGQEEVVTRVIHFSKSLLQRTKGGIIAGIGVAFLFWTVVRMLGNIEKAFNQIWGVKKERPLSRKFTDYLSLMLICPVLLIASGSMTVTITTQVGEIMNSIQFFGYFTDFVLFLLGFLPLVIIWGLLTFIYIFMPNTKIRFVSALTGGILAGTIYQIVQWAYINFQLGAARFGAIYGSFAALPLFLMWLQISWLIVLYGAEVAFAHQNDETYELEPDCLQVSESFKKIVALRIAQFAAKRFTAREKPVTLSELSGHLDMPVRLIREMLFELVKGNILSETRREDADEEAYQPALPPDEITIMTVIEVLENEGIQNLPVEESPEIHKLRSRLQDFAETLRQSPHNTRLTEI